MFLSYAVTKLMNDVAVSHPRACWPFCSSARRAVLSRYLLTTTCGRRRAQEWCTRLLTSVLWVLEVLAIVSMERERCGHWVVCVYVCVCEMHLVLGHTGPTLQAHCPQRWFIKLKSAVSFHSELISENDELNPGCCSAFCFRSFIIYCLCTLLFSVCSSVSSKKGLDSLCDHQSAERCHTSVRAELDLLKAVWCG